MIMKTSSVKSFTIHNTILGNRYAIKERTTLHHSVHQKCEKYAASKE